MHSWLLNFIPNLNQASSNNKIECVRDKNFQKCTANWSSNNPLEIRNQFKTYVNSYEIVPLQWEAINK